MNRNWATVGASLTPCLKSHYDDNGIKNIKINKIYYHGKKPQSGKVANGGRGTPL
jgi:hypothetical protein